MAPKANRASWEYPGIWTCGLDGERILRIVGEAGSGYFFGDGAEKVCALPALCAVRAVRA